jgi:hypothetical protein
MGTNNDTETIEAQWEMLLRHSDEHIRRLAGRAIQEPVLRGLFPFASHSDLRFSRKTSYPFDFGFPFVLTTPSGRYEARDGDTSLLGAGDVDAVIELVAGALKRRRSE